MTSKRWREFSAKSPQHNQIRIRIESARRTMTRIWNEAEGVNFTDEEREFLADDLIKFRACLDQFEASIEGSNHD
jgi:hypothetical protein